MAVDIIFPEIGTLVYYSCTSKLATHVDDSFKLYIRHYISERYNQQNFVLDIIRMIISNAISFYLQSDAGR